MNPSEAAEFQRDFSKKVLKTVESIKRANEPTILRFEIEIPPIDRIRWLQSQRGSTKIFWSDREGSFEMAGVGETEIVTGEKEIDLQTLCNKLQTTLQGTDSNLRYYGGFRFNPGQTPDPSWQRFGAYRFVIPRFESLQRNGTDLLAYNLPLSDKTIPLTQISQELNDLLSPLPNEKEGGIPSARHRSDLPDRTEWYRMIESVTGSFQPERLEKIVLARKSSFEFDRPLDPLSLLQKLRRETPNCFHFCFQLTPHIAFIGASPERLFRREGATLSSEAIAGTRPRGGSAKVDRALAEDLLESKKDLQEHRYVVKGIESALSPLCRSLKTGAETTLLQLAGGQHLYTPIQGVLQNGVSDAELIAALHPTPAVGGFPKERALREIERLEPFDRGWYSGPIGSIGVDQTDLAVAIRSGLVEHRRLSLFSGAGIVEGSTPEGEWEEIEHKIGDFIKILTKP